MAQGAASELRGQAAWPALARLARLWSEEEEEDEER